MRTSQGRDWMARIMGDTNSNGTGDYAPANWMGLTADGTVPANNDTTLAGEIIIGSLARAKAIYAHTTGASSYTLTRVITSDQQVTPRKLGIFTNDAPGGVLVFESLIPSPPQLAPGDQITLTHSVQL